MSDRKPYSLNARLSEDDYRYLEGLQASGATLSGALRIALAKAITFDEIAAGGTPEEIAARARAWAEGAISGSDFDRLTA